MAGNFTINVVVTGAGQGGGQGGGGNAQAINSSVLGAAVVAANQTNLGAISKEDAVRQAFQAQNAKNFNITNANREAAGMAPYELKSFNKKTD